MEKDKLIIELKASKQTVKELKVSLKTYPQKELLKIKEEAIIIYTLAQRQWEKNNKIESK